MSRSSRTKKNKVRNFRALLAVLILVMLAVGCIIAVKTYNDRDEGYKNESEFISFVNSQFGETDTADGEPVSHIDYVYGEEISYAVDYSECSDEDIVAFRNQKIEEIVADFKTTSEKETSQDDADKKAETGENENTLLIKTEFHESDNGVNNLLISGRILQEKNGKMNEVSSTISTYQFSKETGDLLVPKQIFHSGYRETCSEYLLDYFRSYYTDDELLDGWEKYLEPVEENFNKFTVDSAGVVFFFEAGTILKASEGVVCAGVPALQDDDIIRDKIIERYIDPEKPMVALTFDDGPGLESESRILDCLEENNAVATFFYQGMFIKDREYQIKRAYNMGCEIGNHTWNHPVLTSLKTSKAIAQIKKTSETIHEACGHYPTVFRPSYGMTNDKIDKGSELPVIMWSVDTLDWKLRNGEKVFKRVKKSGNLDGKIILLHSIHDTTADATEMIVPWLKSQGYQLVTVTELIKYKTGSEPEAGTTYSQIR